MSERPTPKEEATRSDDVRYYEALIAAELRSLQLENERLRRRICAIRNGVQRAVQPEPGDYSTDHEIREI